MKPTEVNSNWINLALETRCSSCSFRIFLSQASHHCSVKGESKFQVLRLLTATTLDLWLSRLQAEVLLFFLLECQNSNLDQALGTTTFQARADIHGKPRGKLTGSLLVGWDSRIRSGEYTHNQTVPQKGRVFQE